MTMRRIYSQHEFEGCRVELNLLLLQVTIEMLTNRYMLIVLAKIIDMLPIDPSNYLQTFLASLNSLFRNVSLVTEILTDPNRYGMSYRLICNHCHFFSQINSHRFIVNQPPFHQLFNFPLRFYLDHSLSFHEMMIFLQQDINNHLMCCI